MGLDEFAALVNTVTGLSYNAGQLQLLAWRTLSLERVFNTLAGFTAEDDWLPDRVYDQNIEVEGHAVHCHRKSFNKMHREYYKAMGWSTEGIPSEATLKKLDIWDLLQDRFVSVE
jgi:aldehyde:ferredoxin oxidoreductase